MPCDCNEEDGLLAMLDKIRRLEKKYRLFRYIVYPCYLAYGWCFAFLCFCMRVFPVQEDKILFCSMKGRSCGGNPMCIAKELAGRGAGYKVVWIAGREAGKRLPPGMAHVGKGLLPQAYALATSGVWVDANTKPYGALKRKNQLYIQTWHASYGLKRYGLDFPDRSELVDRLIYSYNGRIIDLFVSNSRKTSEIYRSAFGYGGRVLECGSPRNDIFFRDPAPYMEKVRCHFGTHGRKMALYAPTFRKGFRTGAFRLDYARLRGSLEKRFGGEWVVLARFHPSDMGAGRLPDGDTQVLDATRYGDMQELLVACDVLVTDYSSSMFDFALTGKPCFLYAADLGEYEEEQGCYLDPESLPFPLAQDNGGLGRNILAFDEKRYRDGVGRLFAKTGLCENGGACAGVADYIAQWLGGR